MALEKKVFVAAMNVFRNLINADLAWPSHCYAALIQLGNMHKKRTLFSNNTNSTDREYTFSLQNIKIKMN